MSNFLDYLPTANSLHHTPEQLNCIFANIYGIKPTFHHEVFLGLNLQWPNFDLPDTYHKFIISFHTEFIDWLWVIAQAEKIYPRQVLLITDLYITENDLCPDNVTIIRWITIHKQLAVLQRSLSVNTLPKIPSYKISSLSNRTSQYKKFVTAYLLDNFPCDDMMLTYHARLMKPEDLHDHPLGHVHLDKLDFSKLSREVFVNFNDHYSPVSPIQNGEWQISPYVDALVNFTNESYHYSKTFIKGRDTCWPGPYITEKTFKPLLAARPFVCVGQYQSYRFLKEVGFRVDFGFNLTFDQDSGDLTRIKGVFDCIDHVRNTSISDLYDASIEAVQHNSNWIIRNQLYDKCESLNEQYIYQLSIF